MQTGTDLTLTNVLPICEKKKPMPVNVADGGMVACWLYKEASGHE
jgi:hypothetical protein